MPKLSSALLIACLGGGLTTVEAAAQTARSEDVSASNQVEAQGTVISTTPNTLIMRTDEGRYYLFVLDEETTRPSEIPVQSQVTVTFVPTADDDQAPAADFVKVTETPPAQPAQAAAPTDEPVPASVREMEQRVRRQARRYRLGVRAGATLDPELIMVGVHSQLGPFFSERLWARPNAEFAFGEITDLVALNFEGLYQLPIMPRRSRWSVYLGGGPGLNFSRRAFSDEEDGEDIDFDDFDLDVGLNMFVGIQSVSGMFMEVKASAWATPTVRFQVGYNF